jgi:hypothetical protein
MIRSLRGLVPLAIALLAITPGGSLRADKGGKSEDLVSVEPDTATYRVQSIAMLPVATFNFDNLVENKVGAAFAQQFAGTGYRWISARGTKELLRLSLGDSAVKAVSASILKLGRADSLGAPALCARLRVNALLSLRVDAYEQNPIMYSQSGRASTSIAFTSALVDSSGRLLWKISGGLHAEGPYHDPSHNPSTISSTELENTPVTGEEGPPAYEDVLTRLFARWLPQFPVKRGAPAVQ